MELKVKVASVQNSAQGNRIHLVLDDSSTAHEKSVFIEKKRNSDSVDLIIDDPENGVKQGDTFVLALIKRTEEPLKTEPAAEVATDENNGGAKTEEPEKKSDPENQPEGEEASE